MLMDLMDEMRREVERITGIASLPRERVRSTLEQWRLEWRYKAAMARADSTSTPPVKEKP